MGCRCNHSRRLALVQLAGIHTLLEKLEKMVRVLGPVDPPWAHTLGLALVYSLVMAAAREWAMLVAKQHLVWWLHTSPPTYRSEAVEDHL